MCTSGAWCLAWSTGMVLWSSGRAAGPLCGGSDSGRGWYTLFTHRYSWHVPWGESTQHGNLRFFHLYLRIVVFLFTFYSIFTCFIYGYSHVILLWMWWQWIYLYTISQYGTVLTFGCIYLVIYDVWQHYVMFYFCFLFLFVCVVFDYVCCFWKSNKK